MCVMCQEQVRMLDELDNCSQRTFPQSHGSSDLDSFSLYFTSLYSPVLLPFCMRGIFALLKLTLVIQFTISTTVAAAS